MSPILFDFDIYNFNIMSKNIFPTGAVLTSSLHSAKVKSTCTLLYVAAHLVQNFLLFSNIWVHS